MENLKTPSSAQHCPLSSQNSCINHYSSMPHDHDQSEDHRRIMKVPTRRSDIMMKMMNERKYLGVRQRPSGRWVAEIKDSSQKLRLWLGTYDTPQEAALAYDSAATLLRGRNAKTNFQTPSYSSSSSSSQEGNYCSFLGKNPRAYHILKHALIMKKKKNHHHHALLSSTKTIMPNWKNYIRDEFDVDTLVEDASSSSSGCCGVSFGSSKVYSSVVVAPSFSASFLQTDGGHHEETPQQALLMSYTST